MISDLIVVFVHNVEINDFLFGFDNKHLFSLGFSWVMNLGVMLPGSISGYVSDWLGYESFFVFTMFATIPALLITYFVPFTYPDEKK